MLPKQPVRGSIWRIAGNTPFQSITTPESIVQTISTATIVPVRIRAVKPLTYHWYNISGSIMTKDTDAGRELIIHPSVGFEQKLSS